MKVAIIGGGAAGLMAAASAIELNQACEVILLERNDALGNKVIISGGGRCNVTTGIHDLKTVLSKYPRGGKFLTSAMHHFPPSEVYNWFENRGVPLKNQTDDRVFPKSDNGHDIVSIFEKFFTKKNINVRLKTAVTGINKNENQFEIHLRNQSASLFVDRV